MLLCQSHHTVLLHHHHLCHSVEGKVERAQCQSSTLHQLHSASQLCLFKHQNQLLKWLRPRHHWCHIYRTRSHCRSSSTHRFHATHQATTTLQDLSMNSKISTVPSTWTALATSWFHQSFTLTSKTCNNVVNYMLKLC